jgi:hypothetical protein
MDGLQYFLCLVIVNFAVIVYCCSTHKIKKDTKSMFYNSLGNGHNNYANNTPSGPSATASNARADASDAQRKVGHLEADVERLMMMTEALWGILKEQLNYTDDELLKRVQEIDMRDGVLDGKVSKSAPKKCSACDRTVMKKRPKCLYCGHLNTAELFER